jgi:hypothetical protein
MTHPILPKLKMGHNVRNFKEAGKWDVRTDDALKKLSEGLKVDKIETEISSIPDMWARPMLFEMALFNSEHVLHERILGEWRGLLAMLALKEVVPLNRLTVTEVTLPVVRPARDEEPQGGNEADDRDFLLTLAKLLPQASLANDTTWRNLYVFLFNGQPIGMTSPTTLVATAADYLDRINSGEVGWYNGTHLKDPVQALPPRHQQILSGWLANLITRMRQHPGLNQDRWDQVAGLLNEFKRALGAGSCELSRSGFGIEGPEAGVFKYLDKPADGSSIQDASHVRLIPSERRAPAKPLLIFERQIAQQWNMSPQNVTVDGAQTLASTQVQVKNADVWRAADFFTKKLFVIYQKDAFPATLGRGNQTLTLPGGTADVTPLLPLNSGLMQHLTVEDLAERVSWEQTPEGLKLRLFLQLSGPDGDPAGRPVELSKLYRREDIQTLDNVPILEIWPNFKAAGWNAYYTCYSADDVSTTFAAKPFALGDAVESEVPLGGRRQRRYWRTNAYPEAMICRAAFPNTQTNQMEVHDAGLLLLTPPKEVRAQGRTFKVGIDFGATSTTICARTGDQPNPVEFANRKVSVTASGDVAQAQLFDFFLPRRESEMPVLSFFQDFNNNPAGPELRAFLDGHAYLLETAELFDPGAEGLAFDLKWSSERADRRRVRAFLSQLCLQTAAELIDDGATGVSWAFSYPTAFSDEQMEGFPGIWRQVTADCTAQSGLSLLTPNASQTESVAAALYFVNHRNAATAVGTIFMDIGGSTTDISVWQNNTPVWQTSVLLAGRNIFSNYLWHNPDFLGLFDVDVARLPQVKKQWGTDRRPYYALTDALLRYNSERIFEQLPVHAGTEQVKAVRQHLALGVSGLFYYVGSLLQYLMQEGVYHQEVPNVYVGGNGSRIFRWLDIDGEERINALYKAVFSQGAGWTDDQAFRVVLSPEPKREAAYGLVSNGNLRGGNFEHKVLAGESFIAEGMIREWEAAASTPGKNKAGERKLAWNTVLTPEAFTKKLSAPQKLDRLTDFSETFNKFARNRGLVSVVSLNDEQAGEVRKRLGQSLSLYRQTDKTANIVVEPVFIIALRQWLEIRLGG